VFFSLLLLSLLRVRMSLHVYAADDRQVRVEHVLP